MTKISHKMRAWATPQRMKKLATTAALLGVLTLSNASYAQAAADPFSAASGAAQNFESGLKTFALAVGGIGMVACLMLGFFGKLNWRWVATGIGVSFAISAVVPLITYLSSLGSTIGT